MIKFLDPAGCTYYGDKPTIYPLPGPGEKWGPWLEHPQPALPDGEACGSGRYHLMKKLDARYAPWSWWPWWAQGQGLIGEDEEKAAFQAVRLRRILPRVLWRALRLGWGRGACLRGACLRGANLRGADLGGADLGDADLRDAYLRDAYLRGADLRDADLDGVKGIAKL